MKSAKTTPEIRESKFGSTGAIEGFDGSMSPWRASGCHLTRASRTNGQNEPSVFIGISANHSLRSFANCTEQGFTFAMPPSANRQVNTGSPAWQRFLSVRAEDAMGCVIGFVGSDP